MLRRANSYDAHFEPSYWTMSLFGILLAYFCELENETMTMTTIQPVHPVSASELKATTADRREFLRLAASGAASILAIGAASAFVEGCTAVRQMSVIHGSNTVDVSSLTRDGDTYIDKRDQPDGSPILIVRKNGGTYNAVSMRCTHAGCTVNPPAGGQMLCACHSSRFDLDGNVLQGPARSPLNLYTATLNPDGKTLTINF